MSPQLQALLEELERLGEENDAKATLRSEKLLNITRDTGEFLLLLVRALQARRVLEVGTSNGYSTLWLTEAVRPLGGAVTTLEHSPKKAELAAANFAKAGLQPWISLHQTDAGDFLRQQPDASFDLIFLDAERAEYPGWWPDIRRVLRAGGLTVADNALSHAAEMEPFARAVRQTPGYLTSLVPVGKGELLILKP